MGPVSQIYGRHQGTCSTPELARDLIPSTYHFYIKLVFLCLAKVSLLDGLSNLNWGIVSEGKSIFLPRQPAQAFLIKDHWCLVFKNRKKGKERNISSFSSQILILGLASSLVGIAISVRCWIGQADPGC